MVDEHFNIYIYCDLLNSTLSNNCVKMCALGACRAICELPLLEELSVGHCKNVDNTFLKAALATGRQFRIYCKNTNVKNKEFVKEFPDTVTHNANECDISYRCLNGCEHICNNLTFWF